MTAKFVSFVMVARGNPNPKPNPDPDRSPDPDPSPDPNPNPDQVTLGLFLCTLDDGRLAAANAAGAAGAASSATPAAFSAVGLPAAVPGFDSLADNGGAFTTLTGDDLGRGGAGGSASTYN